MTVRFGSSRYEIQVDNSGGTGRGIITALIDTKAIEQRPLNVKLLDDGATHRLQVRLGGFSP
jgi:cyclic beta-1,2-glucan synthetase